MESSPQALHPRGGQDETTARGQEAPTRPTKPTAPTAPTAPTDAQPPLARQIAQLWERHLGSGGIGVDDDFFTRGGNSLIGIKIIEQVAQEYGVQLSVRDFYLAQTPARVAGLIEAGRAAA
ncbi:phosphopantetheine-binding protein [Streptomyces sp. NPDC048551]|uniref:phosphopantetheine-binding protein n=1 Tax=Streptomyces sp. NPDC048551 TaxID=3155758 RepID=UPI0034212772